MAKRYRFGFKRLDVYQEAVAHFDWTSRVVQRMPKGPWRMIDQAVGASLSIVGNVGEANGRGKKYGEVEQHYRYAQGSTFEAATHLDALSSLNVISDDEYNVAEERLARVAAMLTKLMQRQRRRARGAKRPRRQVARPETEQKPGNVAQRESPNPRASGVSEGPEGRPEIEPSRSEVPEGAQRPTGIDPREAGPRGREAPERDRIPNRKTNSS